jgi:hypothetical protein
MPAQDQINGCARGAAKNDRIVREQEFHLVAPGTCQRQRQVFEPNHRIVYARQPERRAILFEVHAFVYQDRNAFGTEKIGY